jgi:type II secretory pathway pseudopilin PulG
MMAVAANFRSERIMNDSRDRSLAMAAPLSSAFTLIELLVVVTIIVALLALLMPALDQAIYQAELAQCAAGQDAVATGATLYAYDHKRSYPIRPGSLEDTSSTSYEPFKLTNKQQSNNPLQVRDLRPVIRPYISAKLWACPFSAAVDLDEPATANSVHILGSYNFWFGFQYAGHAKMQKVGHKFSWTWNGQVYRFGALVSDVDFVKQNETFAFSSHPDKDGMLTFSVAQDQPAFLVLGNTTGAFWQKPNSGPRRGPIDMHVGHQDGSVQRLNDVTNPDDPRIVRVPLHDNPFTYGTGNSEWLQLPRE